jgi:hypothetical protein
MGSGHGKYLISVGTLNLKNQLDALAQPQAPPNNVPTSRASREPETLRDKFEQCLNTLEGV